MGLPRRFVGPWLLTALCSVGCSSAGAPATAPAAGRDGGARSADATAPTSVDAGRDAPARDGTARDGGDALAPGDAGADAPRPLDAIARPDATPSDAGLADARHGDASCELTAGPEILAAGAAGAYLLRGVVVGPTSAFTGEVLVVGDTMTCVATSCSGTAGAATATLIDTHGLIFPGLIDTHNHILFDVFDETDWSPTKVYTNHTQWTSEPGYTAMVNAKQYLNGESGSPWDYGCEMDKYGELKGLVAGTTSIVGAANPANRGCFGSVARTIDQSPNGLPSDEVQVATLFPTKSSADGVCANTADGTTDAYLIHIAEGVDTTARNELAKLEALTTTPACLLAPPTTIVHGTALVDADFATMAMDGMSLTWSPRSNVFLYGGGIDFTKTTDIQAALAHGINISIAPDWSMGGSQNLLDELRFAHEVDQSRWGGILSSQMLFQMVTVNPAKALGLATSIGSLAVGLKADVMVLSGDVTAPYDALLAATPREVRLVLVGGVPLYGDDALRSIAPVPAGAATCETIDACCGTKFACVSRPSRATGDKLDQTYDLIQSSLQQAFADYDAMGLSPYTFSPLTPLIRCGG